MDLAAPFTARSDRDSLPETFVEFRNFGRVPPKTWTQHSWSQLPVRITWNNLCLHLETIFLMQCTEFSVYRPRYMHAYLFLVYQALNDNWGTETTIQHICERSATTHCDFPHPRPFGRWVDAARSLKDWTSGHRTRIPCDHLPAVLPTEKHRETTRNPRAWKWVSCRPDILTALETTPSCDVSGLWLPKSSQSPIAAASQNGDQLFVALGTGSSWKDRLWVLFGSIWHPTAQLQTSIHHSAVSWIFMKFHHFSKNRCPSVGFQTKWIWFQRIL